LRRGQLCAKTRRMLIRRTVRNATRSGFGTAGLVAAALACACGSDDEASSAPVDANAASVIDVGAPAANDAGIDDTAPTNGGEAGLAADAGVGGLRADRFATSVVSVTYGGCGGFGAERMPGVVLGAPVGGGATRGSLDVVALGYRGEIILSVEPNAIVDGPGADFLVFENTFNLGGNPSRPFAEPAEVSVSDDGKTWSVFPCTATAFPYGSCAGWHPTLSTPDNGISPVDVTQAGGDPFDLRDIGVQRARFLRIRDVGSAACPDGGDGFTTHGFDLDAIAVVNAAMP
jgi:hypothetical protein